MSEMTEKPSTVTVDLQESSQTHRPNTPEPWQSKFVEQKDLGVVPDDNLLNSLQNSQEVQKVVREGILLAAGAAAILLQVAMPGVAKGVDNHSSFAYSPLRRLRTTLTFVYCMAYGTKEEKKAVITMVNRAHAEVQGTDYSADDPELQMWVAATLYASGIYMYEEIYGEMDPKKGKSYIPRIFGPGRVSSRATGEVAKEPEGFLAILGYYGGWAGDHTSRTKYCKGSSLQQAFAFALADGSPDRPHNDSTDASRPYPRRIRLENEQHSAHIL
ncbi:hypothetical protein N7474_001789 [Penicillium riverlandense]|uniref:uncharacterized protein n=1 Tax=Penicillium riverlandense TaxID=1903569 RepID=UPI0025478FDD|nr:uncharacterized protein N7474_001789 [Penicillium riverlandense]KAJ5833478.1 hypothetical protein N7474_001789 [Penicillium riverlandense]